MPKKNSKLMGLLSVVIDTYIDKWDPVGSKVLHSTEMTDYAPSTLRKWLNVLEKDGLVYQPYNSSWRLPTIDGLSLYMDEILNDNSEEDKWKQEKFDLAFDVQYARHWLRYIIETLWKVVDCAVVGFIRNDEYYFLWINNLLKNSNLNDIETTKYIVQYIEDKKIVPTLAWKIIKTNNIYYTFLENEKHIISVIYSKINVNGFDSIVSIVWPVRTDYKKNIQVLKKFLEKYNQN